MSELPIARAFDVGINDRLPGGQLLILGLQHVFGMTGMFVFPGLLGRAFNLPPERIAYLYGMTFVVCGLITVLQSVWLLRLPIVQGTYRLTDLVLVKRAHPPFQFHWLLCAFSASPNDLGNHRHAYDHSGR